MVRAGIVGGSSREGKKRVRMRLVQVLAIAVGSALPFASAGAQECATLPAPNLELRPPSVDHINQEIASPDEIARLSMTGNGPAPHPLMAVRYVFDSSVAVVHRVVARADGGFCDAPETVVFRFGVIRRRVVLTPEATAEPCVKSALLAHEAEHNRVVAEAIRAFLQQQESELAQQLRVLKAQASPDEDSAKKAVEIGLIGETARMLDRFKTHEVGRIRQSVDSPARLSVLSAACDGRMAELERNLIDQTGTR